MKREIRNVAASVRQRLLNLARQREESYQLLLERYALERFLYRLSQSPFRDRFILKGAMLFLLWSHAPHRATRDLDLLGRVEPDLARVAEIFRSLCELRVADDGLRFQADTVETQWIRGQRERGGARVRLRVYLGTARVQIQADVGFGDHQVEPPPVEAEYPTLLASEAPRIRAYARETMIAEKLHAMVCLGETNSRLKDFFDVWVLARRFPFQGARLSSAILATFEERDTPLPAEEFRSLSPAFFAAPEKALQWKRFFEQRNL